MNENDRKELGRLIAAQRKTQYGTKSAAYKAASVNAATWDRAEAGETVREDRLHAIVRLMWPSTNGDPDLALARAGNEWTSWEDRDTPMGFGEGIDDRITSWAAEHFERINHTLAEMADAIEALNRKVGGDDGTQASTQKNELDRAREVKEGRGRDELSAPDEIKEAAADDVTPDVDEELGGSDQRE